MGKAAKISTASGVGLAMLGVVVPLTLPDDVPGWISYTLIALGAVLVAVPWLWGFLNRKGDDDGGVTQTTHGPHSPTLSGTFTGPVTFGATPAATQDRKHPRGFSNLLSEAVKAAPPPPKRCPETPMWKAVDYVRAVIGDDDEGHCYPEAQRQIRQAARDNRLEIWGRREIPPQHLRSLEKCDDVWEPIPADYWREFQLSSMATGIAWDDHDHTWAPTLPSVGHGNRYWSLRVDQSEIEREWPKPPEYDTGLESVIGTMLKRPKEPQRPPADLPLTGVLVRVYKALGPPPTDPTKRREFDRKVNMAIADAVALNDLHSWGRKGDYPLGYIHVTKWKRGTFDHHKGNLVAGSAGGGVTTYNDLHFNKAEIERIWPQAPETTK